jgi:hypothetical protein
MNIHNNDNPSRKSVGQALTGVLGRDLELKWTHLSRQEER